MKTWGLSLAIFLLAAGADAANISLLSTARRQGTLTSASIVVPQGIDYAGFEVVIPVDEKGDTTKTVAIRIYGSSDNWETQRFLGGSFWRGEICRDKRTGEIVTCENPIFNLYEINKHYAGLSIRVELDVSKNMQVGARIIY